MGVFYRNDAWGRGIADVLEDTLALIVLASQPQQETIVRKAPDNGFYDVLIFGPTGRSLDLVGSIGPVHLAVVIGRPPGELVIAEASSIANGLRVLTDGGAVNSEGAAMPLDWDGNGGFSTGFVAVWQSTRVGTIEVIRAVPFDH